MLHRIQMIGIVVGMILLFFGVSIVPMVNIVKADISWDTTVNFNEPGGTFDNATFGEAPDAHGGEPADNYDIDKPPAPMPSYIRAYFKDNLLTPFDKLWSDYRHYPDTTKVWNLSVQWYPEDETSPTTITMSWSTGQLQQSEYTNVSLCTNAGGFLKNMLVDTTYTFSSPAFTIQNFKIICTTNNPPYTPSGPSPVNSATGVSVTTNLGWTGGDPNSDTVTYDVYFGTSSSPPKLVGNQSSASYNPSGSLSYSTLYYWKIVAWDEHHASTTGPLWHFTTTSQPNRPPTFSNPSPVNGSTGVNRYHATNVTVSDLDGNSTTVCFWYSTVGISGPWTKAQQNNNVVANTTVRDLNSSYASGWNTQYWWKVTADDGHANSSVVYRFTTKSQQWVNRAPTFSSPSPANGSSGVNRYHATNVTVSDLDGNLTTICFWYSTVGISGPWTKTQQNNTVVANTTVRDLNSSYANGWNTQYWWRVTAFDGQANSSVIYTFNTRAMGNNPPVFGTPSPVNGSTGNQLSLSWSISITDLEGNPFSWSITCSNGQNNSNTTASNGTKSLSLSGLTNSKAYKIWVNATDPTGSDTYTRKWYTFTTKSASGGGGSGGGEEIPNTAPTADASASEHFGTINTPVLFNGSRSIDPDGSLTYWAWDFGDNTNGTGEKTTHRYPQAGTYTVILTVTDNDNAIDTDTTTVIISLTQNTPPTPPIINGTNEGTKNTQYSYSIYSTDQENDLLQYTITWGDGTQNTSTFLQNETQYSVPHSWTSAGKYLITATATDNTTISEQATLTVFIDVYFVHELGFLFDNNNDGLIDSFYTNNTGQITPAQKLANESYRIDTDADGIPNYLYNPSLDSLTEIQTIATTEGFPWIYIAELLIILVSIAGVVVYLRRNCYI